MSFISKCKGTLLIKVISAEGFPENTEAYVRIEVEDGLPTEVETSKSADPVLTWNQQFPFQVKKSRGLGSHKVWIYIKSDRLLKDKEIGYCEFKYDDTKMFPSGEMVQIRGEKVAGNFLTTKATLDLDITVTWHDGDKVFVEVGSLANCRTGQGSSAVWAREFARNSLGRDGSKYDWNPFSTNEGLQNCLSSMH